MKFPNMPIKGRPVIDTVREIISFIRATRVSNVVNGRISQTPNGTTIYCDPKERSKKGGSTAKAFWVVLGQKEDESYYVTVTDGYVVDHITAAGDALSYRKPENNKDEGGQLVEFPVEENQSVFVKVVVDAVGAVAAEAVSIIILADEDEPPSDPPDPEAPESNQSVHYFPSPHLNDEPPTGGTYYYKLARVKNPAEGQDPPPETTPPLKLEQWLAGENLDHWRELPTFDHMGTGKKIMIGYNKDEAEYRLRTLARDSRGELSVKKDDEPDGDGADPAKTAGGQGNEILFRGNSRCLTVVFHNANEEAPEAPTDEYFEFQDGLTITGAIIHDLDELDPEDPEAPEVERLNVPLPVTKKAEAAAEGDEPQIEVTSNGRIYSVRGNSVNGKLTYSIGEGSTVDLIEWKDGLVVTGNPEGLDSINIPIPASGAETTGANINLGYRQINIVQDSEPPWVNFTVASTIAKWLYVRDGLIITDRATVTTPDDAGTGAGEVYPRIIHLLPIDNTGTAGTALSGDDRGGWIDAVPPP